MPQGSVCSIQDVLDAAVDLFPFGQEFVQFALTADTTQCHLGELRGGKKIIFDFPHRQIGVDDPKIKHGVDLDRDVVASDHVLRWDIHGHRAQIQLDHFFDARNDVDHARTARADHAAEPEHYSALVLFENLDAANKRGRRDNDKRRYRSESKHVALLLLVRRLAALNPAHF